VDVEGVSDGGNDADCSEAWLGRENGWVVFLVDGVDNVVRGTLGKGMIPTLIICFAFSFDVVVLNFDVVADSGVDVVDDSVSNDGVRRVVEDDRLGVKKIDVGEIGD